MGKNNDWTASEHQNGCKKYSSCRKTNADLEFRTKVGLESPQRPIFDPTAREVKSPSSSMFSKKTHDRTEPVAAQREGSDVEVTTAVTTGCFANRAPEEMFNRCSENA